MRTLLAASLVFVLCQFALSAESGVVPAAAEIKATHPRLLVRPSATPLAISLDQLKSLPQDADFKTMLDRLKGEKGAMAQAMLYLVTGDRAAADRAVQELRAFKSPENPTAFSVYFGLRNLAFAYDWLYGYDGFTAEMKAEVRRNAAPLAGAGLKISDDHVFHNYVWMSTSGVTLWALAAAGDDAHATRLLDTMRGRLNERMYPGMEYLNGAPGEPLWYGALYDFSPAALTVLAVQSAFEVPLVDQIRKDRHDWLGRQFQNIVHNTQPDMTYITWGDTKVGPDGGVTHEMAGVLDALTWAMQSPEGAYFSRWIAAKRGPSRFYGETAVFYFLYSRRLPTEPKAPALAFFAGGPGGGHIMTRSAWVDDATVVGFRCTDHYGDHNHFDQGSFTIFRNGPLAVDPTAYRKVGGPQQKTDFHNTLLIGGQGQRPVHGQHFRTVDEFKANLTAGANLETGDILFYHDDPGWTAVAGQFAQAYAPGTLRSCVRQLLFIRPGTVVVVDHLIAAEGKTLGPVQWLLNVPKEPTVDGAQIASSNGKSRITCASLSPVGAKIAVDPGLEKSFRATFTYTGENALTLVHLLQVDGTFPKTTVQLNDKAVQVTAGAQVFSFARQAPFDVAPMRR